jgi:DNA-binding protein WhiA
VLSEAVRAELARIAPRRRCDRLAELSGLFHSAGALHIRGHGEVSLHLDLVSSAVARRAFELLRGLDFASEIRTYRRRSFGRETRYQLHVEGTIQSIATLREAGVLSSARAPLARPPHQVIGRRCCRAAYLRGALLGAGTVSGPRAPHFEVRCATREGAEFLCLAAGLEGVTLQMRERERFAIAYAKGAERIADALALAGAVDAALVIEEHAVLGAARAQANRVANADHANLVRVSRAAHEQMRAIKALEGRGRLERLPEPLREIAELRLRHPYLSLTELARKCSPPASKAAAHRRLRQIARLAEAS